MSNLLYTLASTKLLAKLQKYGMQVKVKLASGHIYTTWGIRAKSELTDVDLPGQGAVSKQVDTFIIPRLKNAPSNGDRLVIGPVTYSIDKVTIYRPTNIDIGYSIEVTQ